MTIQEYFTYCEKSPSGLRRVGSGKAVGSIDTDSRRGLYQRWRVWHPVHKLMLAHRVVWELLFGEIPDGFIVDHKDGNALNNHKDNLRLVLIEINSKNATKRSDNTSGITGVGFRTIKGIDVWFAMWKENGKDRTKTYSCNKYGYEGAKQLAIQTRQTQLDRLRKEGEDYTERHGT